jgi:hypothetical protein
LLELRSQSFFPQLHKGCINTSWYVTGNITWLLHQSTTKETKDLEESNTQSFIVKVWIEETIEESGEAKWRGHVTHVQSGKRQYLQNLDGVAAFIAPYLKNMGVNLSKLQQTRRWLHRWRRAVAGRQ